MPKIIELKYCERKSTIWVFTSSKHMLYFIKNMKILITGGGGFQGSHLAEGLIKDGHAVTVLNTYSEEAISNLKEIRSKVNIIWGSITDKESVEKSVRGHDVVFHLAARINVDESIKYPYAFVEANVLGTLNMLEATKQHGTRLIYASSCEVYGDGHDLGKNEKLDETAELKPNSPYAASKAAADRFCYAYYKTHKLNVTVVRPFNVYGERQKSGTFGALIPILVNRALNKNDLLVFGDGTATRDYSHVSDIIRGYMLVLKNNQLAGKTVNLASGQNTSVKDIANFIAKKMRVKITHVDPRPGEVKRFPANITLASELGYKPKVKIWDGIDRYIAWAKAAHNAPSK